MKIKYINIVGLSLTVFLIGCAQKHSLETQNTQLNGDKLKIVDCPAIKVTDKCEITNTYDKNKPLWIFGNVLTQSAIYTNGGIEIDSDGIIQQVGCIEAPKDAVVLNCSSYVISPGLINPHDHLKYNHNFPGGQNNRDATGNISNPYYLLCNDPIKANTLEVCQNYRYDRRNEWRKGLEGKPQILAPDDAFPNTPEATANEYKKIVWNELRHIMAGTTTVAGSGGYYGLVRNPDVSTM
ncbi:MAG: hypothetical protein WC149_12335, partial [Arcobacteraceae bacterium]